MVISKITVIQTTKNPGIFENLFMEIF